MAGLCPMPERQDTARHGYLHILLMQDAPRNPPYEIFIKIFILSI